MAYTAINLKEKLGKFSEHWLPRVVAELNDYQFKLAKTQGDAPKWGKCPYPSGTMDNGALDAWGLYCLLLRKQTSA